MAIYLDTETTGLSARQGDRIVEIALVDELGGVILETLVDPERSIPSQASRIHGIYDHMVVGKPRLSDLLPIVRSHIRGQHLVIFNKSFDVQFFPCRLNDASAISCAMSRINHALSGRYSLEKAAFFAGYTWKGTAHRALADALACRAVWRYLEGEEADRNDSSSDSSERDVRLPEEGQIASADGNDVAYELIERILDWAYGSDEFDPSWVLGVKLQLDSGRPLSVNQLDALVRIVERWRVP